MRIALSLLPGLLLAAALGCTDAAEQRLFVNIFPVEADEIPGGADDPLADLDHLRARGEDGAVWPMTEDQDQSRFGPIGASEPFRLRLEGLDAGGQMVSWGCSPRLALERDQHKTSLFFSRTDLLVAHAGPALVDPEDGLEPIGAPWSLQRDGVCLGIVHNDHHIYFELRVADERIVDNEPTSSDGDRVVLGLDLLGDNEDASHGVDDLVLSLGPTRFAAVWNPLQLNVVHDFRPDPESGCYTVFAAVPLMVLEDNSPGPKKRWKLGLEIVDDDGQGAPSAWHWPSSWEPGGSDYSLLGAGTVVHKTRLLDARRVERDAVVFDGGMDPFIDSGAVALERSARLDADRVWLYALWDSEALMLAVESEDALLCAQERADGDFDSISRDDAVELALVPREEEPGFHSLFDLGGAVAYERLDGGAWTPAGIYFRFDLDGPYPENDCRQGAGYRFQLRIPWSDLGYEAAPPAEGDLLAFDLSVLDTDRGAARTRRSFSPAGPALEPQHMAELRLFDY
ncbi:MAG: hypothetical protein JXR96_20745 [Deltaproteobacteria bacterium]|nr:hypothetical protein [Deltaproteobacteria bacterium]